MVSLTSPVLPVIFTHAMLAGGDRLKSHSASKAEKIQDTDASADAVSTLRTRRRSEPQVERPHLADKDRGQPIGKGVGSKLADYSLTTEALLPAQRQHQLQDSFSSGVSVQQISYQGPLLQDVNMLSSSGAQIGQPIWLSHHATQPLANVSNLIEDLPYHRSHRPGKPYHFDNPSLYNPNKPIRSVRNPTKRTTDDARYSSSSQPMQNFHRTPMKDSFEVYQGKQNRTFTNPWANDPSANDRAAATDIYRASQQGLTFNKIYNRSSGNAKYENQPPRDRLTTISVPPFEIRRNTPPTTLPWKLWLGRIPPSASTRDLEVLFKDLPGFVQVQGPRMHATYEGLSYCFLS